MPARAGRWRHCCRLAAAWCRRRWSWRRVRAGRRGARCPETARTGQPAGSPARHRAACLPVWHAAARPGRPGRAAGSRTDGGRCRVPAIRGRRSPCRCWPGARPSARPGRCRAAHRPGRGRAGCRGPVPVADSRASLPAGAAIAGPGSWPRRRAGRLRAAGAVAGREGSGCSWGPAAGGAAHSSSGCEMKPTLARPAFEASTMVWATY